MANNVFDPAAEGFGLGEIDFDGHKWRAILVDMDDAGPTPGSMRITAVTNTDPATFTTAAAHGLAVGDKITVFGVQGAAGANNPVATPFWRVASVPSATTFTVDLPAAPGAYDSGGYIGDLEAKFLSEFVPAVGQTSRSNRITGKTVTDRVFSSGPITFPQVSGDRSEAVLLCKTADTDTDATADLADAAIRLVCFYDSLAGLPVTPGSPAADLTWTPTSLFTL